MSGSGTGLFVGSLVIVLMLGFHLLTRFSGASQILISLFVAAALLLTAAAVAFFYTPEELFVATTEGLGKDATLTGRTDLWEIGLEAVAEKVWFGWGYDGHYTVLSTREYFVPFVHYHNGFLDSTIAGGVVLLILLLLILTGWLSILFRPISLALFTPASLRVRSGMSIPARTIRSDKI